MKNKKLIVISLSTAIVLLIPLIAMHFTDEVNWNLFDYVAAAVLVFGTGLILSSILKKVKLKNRRIILTIVIILLFLLIWAELGVGIFGTPFAGD